MWSSHTNINTHISEVVRSPSQATCQWRNPNCHVDYMLAKNSRAKLCDSRKRYARMLRPTKPHKLARQKIREAKHEASSRSIMRLSRCGQSGHGSQSRQEANIHHKGWQSSDETSSPHAVGQNFQNAKLQPTSQCGQQQKTRTR